MKEKCTVWGFGGLFRVRSNSERVYFTMIADGIAHEAIGNKLSLFQTIERILQGRSF